MKFGVDGRWGAEITLGGVPLALTPQTLQNLTITSGVTKPMPTCTFTVLDQGADFITNVGVKDGMPLKIVLEDGVGGPQFDGDFVVVGGPRAHYSAKGVVFTVNAFLNKVAYLRKVTNTAKKVNSGEMISTLAKEAGISKIDIDPTNDMMAWLGEGVPIAKRISSIADHGWAGADSAMVHVLTETGMLRYKNLATLATAAAGVQFGGVVKDPFIRGAWVPVVQFLADSKQGLYNNAAAWGAVGVVPSMSGLTGIGTGDVLELQDGLGGVLAQFTEAAGNISKLMSGAGLNISSEIQGSLGALGSKVNHFPLSSGNTHKKYWQASQQNLRGRAAFGNDIHVLSTQASGATILDTAYYHCTHPVTLADIAIFSGDYIITEKQMMLMAPAGGPFGYFEITTLTSNSGG